MEWQVIVNACAAPRQPGRPSGGCVVGGVGGWGGLQLLQAIRGWRHKNLHGGLGGRRADPWNKQTLLGRKPRRILKFFRTL